MGQVMAEREYLENLGFETDEYCKKFKDSVEDESACLILESHEVQSLPGYSCYVDTYRLISHPTQANVGQAPVFTDESKDALTKIIIPAGDYKKMEWDPSGSRLTVTY